MNHHRPFLNFSFKAAILSLAFCVCMPTSAYAEQIFVRNRLYQGQSLKEGGATLLEFQPLMAMLELKVVRGATGAWVVAGKETTTPSTATPVSSFQVNGQEVALIEKDGRVFVALDQLSTALNLKISKNAQLDSIDIYAAAAGSGSAGTLAAAPAPAATSATAAPTPRGTPFTNSDLGLTFIAPKDCTLVTNQALLQKNLAEGLTTMGEKGRQLAARTMVGLQFQCMNTQHPEAAMSFLTEQLPSSLLTLEQYAQMNIDSIRTAYPQGKIVATSTTPQNIGGRDFRVIQVNVEVNGMEVHARSYIAVDPLRTLGYCISMVTRGTSGFTVTERMLSGFSFTK